VSFGYASRTTFELLLERKGLEVQHENIKVQLAASVEDAKNLQSGTVRSTRDTIGSVIVTGTGAVVGLTNPLAIIAFFGGALLAYMSGKNAMETAASASEKQLDVDVLNLKLKDIDARLDTIRSILSTPQRMAEVNQIMHLFP